MHRSAFVPLLFAFTVAAQESRPASQPLEKEARTALDTLARTHAQAKVMRADYVQHRTTPLRKKPLESKGTLWFRAEPACIVFAVAEPKPARIRLDVRAYEVLRPEQRQLERFLLASADLPNALFGSLRSRWSDLQERLHFAGASLDADGRTLVVRFVPRDESVRPYLTGLEIAVASDGSALREVTYVDGQGDRVRITFTALELDPKGAEPPFETKVPEGTAILEHVATPPPGKKAGGRG